jgi:transposase
MAYFLGCDVSKRKLDLCLVDGLGAQVWVDQVPNEEADIATFLLAVSGSYPEVTCVVEATACYHVPFAETAYAQGLVCMVYNPILTKQQIRTSIRSKKTDRTDALIIARLGLRGEGRPFMPEPYSLTKYYARGQQRLSQFAGAVDIYQTHVEDLLGQGLSQETSAALDEVRAAFKKAKLQFSRDMTASAPTELCRRLQSIPGVGPYIAASIIGEIQDMSRFRTGKQLTAFAGLDPRIRQSGHTLNSTGRLTKRGSSYLRRSLFIAASVARQRDPNFKALYDKKRTEGKPYTVAVCVVARKLLSVVRAIWLTDTNYEVGSWSRS